MSMYRCAVCGSRRVVTETKQEGYNAKKGFLGMALFGLGGAVAGAEGNTTTYYHCADCGHTLNKCMPEIDKMFIDEYLRNQTSANVSLLRKYKMQYPNIEWEDTFNENNEEQELIKEKEREERRRQQTIEREKQLKEIEELKKSKADELKIISEQAISAEMAVLNALYKIQKPCTIFEMQQAETSCLLFSLQRLSSATRVLTENKIIEGNVGDDIKMYFKAIPDSKDEAIRLLKALEINKESQKPSVSDNDKKKNPRILAIQMAILDKLYSSETAYHALEIWNPEMNCTMQNIHASLYQMVKKGIIHEIHENGKIYYRPNPISKDEAIKMLIS